MYILYIKRLNKSYNKSLVCLYCSNSLNIYDTLYTCIPKYHDECIYSIMFMSHNHYTPPSTHARRERPVIRTQLACIYII